MSVNIAYKPPTLSVRPEDFGAVGDGSTDDATACQAAIDAAGATGGIGCVQFTPGKTYKLNSGLTVNKDNQIIIAHGAQLTVNFSGVGITVGTAGGGMRHVRWYGGRIIRSSNNFTSGNIGLRLLNLNHSGFYDFKIFGFEKGVELLGDGHGTQYNTLLPAEIGYCKHGIALIARNSGWANANEFLGSGRVGYYTDQPSATGGYAIYLNRESSSANVINQNQFYGITLENAGVVLGAPSGAIYANCQDCLFHGLRYEGFTSPKIEANTTDFEGNHFDAGNSLLDPTTDLNLPSDPRAGFYQGYRGALWCGGGGVDALLTLKNRGNATDKVLSVKQTDGTERIVLRADGRIAKKTSSLIGRYEGAAFGGSKSWNPGTVNAGDMVTTTVTISGPGGATGLGISSNPCIAALSTYKPGLLLFAHIDPAQTGGFNTAQVTLYNPTAYPIVVDNGGTITVHVYQMEMT